MLSHITENPGAEKGCTGIGWKMVLELRTDTEKLLADESERPARLRRVRPLKRHTVNLSFSFCWESSE